MPTPPAVAARAAARERLSDVLTSTSLAHVVDLVAWPEADPGSVPTSQAVVHVANVHGHARLTPNGPQVLAGRNPVLEQDPRAFLPYQREVADPAPPNSRNAYPLAWRRLSAVFGRGDRSPDLVIVHTPRHFFPEQGGHVGEHGSLDVIQSRAPLLLSGPGVARGGVLPGWARVVDVAPTLAVLAGVDVEHLQDGAGRPLDGRVLTELLADAPDAPDAPRRVVGILWDGAHCGELLAMAQAGSLPGVARLLEAGVALDGGAVAEFPSVTLANHTSLLTGVGVDRHGILGNVYVERATGRTVVTNTGSAWHQAADWTDPRASTVWEMLARGVPGAVGVCVNEPTDRGATSSTMQAIRASGSAAGADALTGLLPAASSSPYVESLDLLTDPYYAWCTQVDDVALLQVLEAWRDPSVAPTLTWWANAVTDAGHHAGGPRSAPARQAFIEADRRLERFLDHLDGLGVTDEVTFLLTADHGFEGSDPGCRGDWAAALAASGVPCRDVGPGFVTLR
jgi:predicted AlkP superfamily pyrophosphatase or phosphodiesterase